MNEYNTNDITQTELNTKKQPLFDLLTLFLLCLVFCLLIGTGVGYFFKNWYLGLIIGSFFGTVIGLILIFFTPKKP